MRAYKPDRREDTGAEEAKGKAPDSYSSLKIYLEYSIKNQEEVYLDWGSYEGTEQSIGG